MTQSDKPYSERSGSFIARHMRRKSEISSPRTPDLSNTADDRSEALSQQNLDDFVAENLDELVRDHSFEQVSNEIDQFINILSSTDDKSSPPDVPDTVETFCKIVEARIGKYYSGEANSRFGKMTEDDASFFDAVDQISKLTNALSDFSYDSATLSSLNRTSMALQRAMSFLEEEFRDVLEGPRIPRASSMDFNNNFRSHSSTSISRNDSTSSVDHCNNLHESQTIAEDEEEDVFPGYSNDSVLKMVRIAATMISAGYESECRQIYSTSRRNAFEEALRRTDFEKTSIEDVQKMQWESLEKEIGKWIKSVKQCTTVLFPGERKLCGSIFPEQSVSESIFGNLARSIVIQLLNFTDAVVLTKRSAEKLFKYLDMYETLRDLIPSVESCSGGEVKSEILSAADRLGEAAVFIFCELENSIKGDAARTGVPGGAVHPLTRYVMNYLKYVCEYRDTLDHIFQKEKALVRSSSLAKKGRDEEHDQQMSPGGSNAGDKLTPFGIQLMTVIELLDENLTAKTRLYRDPSLQSVFLMNNGRYILQKVKGSTEILQLMGDTRYRMRSTVVRQYHKNYQRETWGRVLQCLSQEGLLQGGHGKVQKQALKDRFKSFNTMMEDIHKNQSTWVVNEEQLQSELRVSISAVVIPAYRAFLGRFKHCLDGSRHVEKYIKYQPDDIESLIEDLFDGNALSMARRT